MIMEEKTELCELTTGLREVEAFLCVFDEFAKNSTNTEILHYVNGVISMISMQSAKIRELIGLAERLEKESY